MNLLKFISDIFKLSTSKTDSFHSDEEVKKKKWDIKYNDLGIFSYNDSGFNIELDNKSHSIKWRDVERLQAYKVDLMTTDEICIDITYNNKCIITTEETPGWYQFLEKFRLALPNINNNWEASVLKSPFEYDLTTIYERADRKMPEKSNFFSIIKGKNEEDISTTFERNGWTIRKSTKNFKLENSWTELILDRDKESLLLHGLVAYHFDNIEIMRQLFDKLQCGYEFEFYDENKLVERTQNGI